MRRPELGAGPPREGSIFRAVLGVLCVLAGIIMLVVLALVPIPPGNREPLMLAIGLVLGWGSNVVNSEYGSSPAGRQMVDISARKLEEKP